MSTDEYVPDEEQVRGRYCDGTYLQTGHTTEGDDFDAWLARVKRDAARGALDGLVRQEEEAFLRLHVNDAPISAAAAQYARSAAEAYKHEHYPEEATP